MTAWTAFLQAILLGVTVGAISNGPWKFFDKTKSTYKVFEQELGWADAASACWGESARLVQIRSKEENDFVLSLLKKGTSREYWIGLHKLPNGYFDWEGGLPFLQNYMPFERQDFLDMLDSNICVAISAAGEREWKARDCEIENKPKANYYICERVNQSRVRNWLRNMFVKKFTLLQDVLNRLANRTATTEVATTTEQEEEETEEEEPWRFCGKGIMYKVFDYGLSFDDAVTECNTMGGRLAHIETKFEFDCVTESFSDYNVGSKYWIGLKTRNTQPYWEDGSKAKCPGCDLYWSTIPHATSVYQEMCYSAYYAYNKLVYQEEEECSNTLPFMCQIQKATSSSSSNKGSSSRNQPWQSFSQTKKQYKAYPTPQNWNRATATCAKEGGRLVQIQSGKEVKYLRDNMPSNFGEPYWIGLQKEGGAYKWKKSGNDVSYAVSKLANRKSEGDKDRCYMMWTEAPRNFPVKAGFLYGDNCQEKKSFICERDEKKEKKGKKNTKRK